MEYSAVIRTLGTAGEKFQTLLDSLCAQTIRPDAILVYIAEGYSIPKETCGKERYVYVKKGMVAQRALEYKEVNTDYMLLLDDDMYLPPNFVEDLFNALVENNADVVAPNIYDHSSKSLKTELLMSLSGRIMARRGDSKWGYKVLPTGGFSYNKYPNKRIYISQTNAGSCLLCKKSDFLKISFSDEIWLDEYRYAIGDDQMMFYKMYLMGFKQLTLFETGIVHLDAGGNLGSKNKEKQLIEADYFFKTVFWHRFIQTPEKNLFKRIRNVLAINYYYVFGCLISVLKGNKSMLRAKLDGIHRAKDFIKSSKYQSLPRIINTNNN